MRLPVVEAILIRPTSCGGWAGFSGLATLTPPSAEIVTLDPSGTVIGPPSPMTGRPSPFWITPPALIARSPRRE